MARITVTAGDGRCTAGILTDPETGETTARTGCGRLLTDRGHFGDTVRMAEAHVDQPH